MGRGRDGRTIGRALRSAAAAAVLGATLSAAPAHAAGGFTAVFGGGDPLHALGNYNPSTYLTIDVDGDGDLDVTAREHSSDASIDYLRNDGGAFVATAGAANPFAGISFAANPANFVNTRVLVGDFDVDGDIDLWHHGVGFAALYRNDGAAFSAQSGANDPLAALATRDPGSYVVADVDGDSDADVVVRDDVTDATIELLRNDHGTFVVTSAPFAGISFAPNAANFVNTCVLVLDADHDGDVDLWHQGAGFAALYRNDGATFSEHIGIDDPLHELAGYDTHSYVAIDVDSDGDLDVVAREPVGDVTLDVLRNDGGTFTRLTGGSSPFAAVTLAIPEFVRSYVLAGDHDGDGDADLYNQALNELYRQAGSAPTLTSRSPAPASAGVAVTADLSLTFGEPVALGAGSVVLRDAATGALLHRLDVGAHAARFTGAGTATITVDLPSPLPFATNVTVTVEPGAFVGASDGDAHAGLASTAWRFTTAANTAPTISALDGDAGTYVEGAAPLVLDDAGAPATAGDADGIGFEGGELRAEITSGGVLGEDHLTIGLFDGDTTVTVPLDASDDAASVSGLLRVLAYRSDAGDDPTPGARVVTVTVTDGGGLTATATATIDVDAIDDPPTVDVPARLDAAAGAVTPIGSVVIADPDLRGGTLQVRAVVDVGSLGDDPLELVGTPAALMAELGTRSWTAPTFATTGALTLVVADGTTAVHRSIPLHVHASPHPDEPAPAPPGGVAPPPAGGDAPPAAGGPPRDDTSRAELPLLTLPEDGYRATAGGRPPGAAGESAFAGSVAASRPPAPSEIDGVGAARTATPTTRPAQASTGAGVPIAAILALVAAAIVLVVAVRARRGVG